MKNIKFREQLTNGNQETTLKWNNITKKEDLLVEVFTTEKLFKDLSKYWKDLEDRTDCKLCMSYDWAYTWWQHFGKNEQRSIYILTFWDGTKLVGLAPCYKGYSTSGDLNLETRLQLMGSGGSPNEQIGYEVDQRTSNFLDILVDDAYSDVVAKRMADLLTPEFLGVDVIKFHHTSDDSFIINKLYPNLEGRVPEMALEHTNSYPYINLTQQKLLTEYINDQKSKGRNLQKSSSVDQEKEFLIKDATTSWSAVEEALENLFQLHQSNRTRLVMWSKFRDKRFKEFFGDILKQAYHNDNLWFKQVYSQEQVCASRVIIKYNNCYYDYISSIDNLNSHAENHVENGMLINLIEDALNDEFRQIKSLKSADNNKYDFLSGSYRNWKLTIQLKENGFNIFLLFNRFRAFLYKYFA